VRLIPGFQKILGAASGKNREVKIYDRTQEDPSFENVAEASHFANVFAAQAVIGIGGGSVLDTAKIVAATITNDIPISAMIGSDWIPAAAAPLVCFPTTAGNGSEVTNVAVLTDMSDGIKKAIVSNRLVPLFAGLLPELTISLLREPPQRQAWMPFAMPAKRFFPKGITTTAMHSH
jgi:alcohol dehydrogenase class IV